MSVHMFGGTVPDSSLLSTLSTSRLRSCVMLAGSGPARAAAQNRKAETEQHSSTCHKTGGRNNRDSLSKMPGNACTSSVLRTALRKTNAQCTSRCRSCTASLFACIGCVKAGTTVLTFAQIGEAVLADVEQPQVCHVANCLRQCASDVVPAKIQKLQGCTGEHSETSL